MAKQKHFASASFFILACIGTIIGAAVLKIAAVVLIPLVLAILLAFVFEPIVMFLNTKLRIPKVFGIFIIMIAVLLVIFGVGNILFSSIRTILLQYPKYESRFMYIYQTIAQMFNLPFNKNQSLFSNLWEQMSIRAFIQQSARSFSTSLITFLKDALLVFLFTFFLLAELRFFREKVELAFDQVMPDKIRSVFADIIGQTTRYISVKFYISLLTGVIVFVGTLLVGLDFPVIWGFIAFVLNFIPNFGSIFSGCFTAVFALVQFWPEPGPVIYVGILMLSVNMILGNFIEPKVQGKNLGLSPFVIIASLSVWGWLWGFAGLILAVPLMVIMKIICENVEFLYPVSIMLGSLPPELPPEQQPGRKKEDAEQGGDSPSGDS